MKINLHVQNFFKASKVSRILGSIMTSYKAFLVSIALYIQGKRIGAIASPRQTEHFVSPSIENLSKWSDVIVVAKKTLCKKDRLGKVGKA